MIKWAVMDIKEIQDILLKYDRAEDEEFRWVYPGDVTGFSFEEVKRENERRYFLLISNSAELKETEELPSSLIAEYLKDCLDLRSRYLKQDGKVPPALDVDAGQIMDAMIFLMRDLGCSQGAFWLSLDREPLFESDLDESVGKLKKALLEAEGFVHDIIRLRIMDLFWVEPDDVDLHPAAKGRLSQESLDFLKSVADRPTKIDPVVEDPSFFGLMLGIILLAAMRAVVVLHNGYRRLFRRGHPH